MIRHRTTYHYRVPVRLGPHRLMVRPRESHDIRVLSSDVDVSDGGTVLWSQDVAGNAVGVARFSEPTNRLGIDCISWVEIGAVAYPVFDIAASATSFPFRYADEDWTDLGALAVQQHTDAGQLSSWAQGYVASTPTDTLSLLKDLNVGTSGAVSYKAREGEGTQTPTETLVRGTGSCRDFATLFVEAARSLGFGARAVSGYLHDPTRTLAGSADAGSMHAWAEVFVPGAGWIAFDPTNCRVGGADLIPVAVVRDIRLAMPVTGSYIGEPGAFVGMAVEVSVTER